MNNTPSRALVLAILRHAQDFPWRINEIGLLALRLDDQREYRLHVWDPTHGEQEPPIHDHPYDFTSTVIAGEIFNTRYREDPGGDEYIRIRYRPEAEHLRRSDTVRLSEETSAFTEGGQYRQASHELHASRQLPGTVTMIRCSWVAGSDLTVCVRDAGQWVSGRARDATPDEIKIFAASALEWF